MAAFVDDIGAHCAVVDCHKIDFLPFTCDQCSKKHCLDHRTYDAHSCEHAQEKQLTALFCPICNQSVNIKRGQDRNDIVFFEFLCDYIIVGLILLCSSTRTLKWDVN